MQRTRLTFRTAFLFALGISLLMNLLFLIMFFYGREAVIPGHEMRPRPEFSLSMILLNILFNFIMAFTLYMLNFKLLETNWPNLLKHPVIVLSTLLTVILLSLTFSHIHIWLSDIERHPAPFIRGGMARDFMISLIVIFSSQLMYLKAKQQQTALEYKTLLSENMRTRYAVLKNQVDPHFLFNSLNTLNSLIKTDADKAQEYVQQLSSVFRYTLQTKEVISLQDELQFVQSYSHLMQIRYGDNLQLEYHIDPVFYNFSIIPLSLQTLVENAIKHNVISNKQPLLITFDTHEDATISVSNPIQMKKEREDREGIGLANLAERYRLMWQREIMIRQDKNVFEVILPLMKIESL